MQSTRAVLALRSRISNVFTFNDMTLTDVISAIQIKVTRLTSQSEQREENIDSESRISAIDASKTETWPI
jgi:hypothetical protein